MKETILKAMGSVGSASGRLRGWSNDFQRFYSSGYRCPQCNERAGLNFYSSRKERIPSWKVGMYLGGWGMYPFSFDIEFAECPKCNFIFKLKGDSELNVPKMRNLLSVVETDRTEENIGTDKKLIDNSMSSVSLKRKFVVSKQWTKTYIMEHEKAQSESSGLTIGVNEASIRTNFEETLKKKFSISEEGQEIYSEEVEIEVPAFTKLNVFFNWKRIWQCGFIHCLKNDGEKFRIPFRVAVGITFDQIQVDESSH